MKSASCRLCGGVLVPPPPLPLCPQIDHLMTFAASVLIDQTCADTPPQAIYRIFPIVSSDLCILRHGRFQLARGIVWRKKTQKKQQQKLTVFGKASCIKYAVYRIACGPLFLSGPRSHKCSLSSLSSCGPPQAPPPPVSHC